MRVPEPRPYTLGPDEGRSTAFLGALLVHKAGARETGGLFDLLDQRVPSGYAPPRHVHHREDEAWYLLDGTARFWCGEAAFEAAAGSFVYLPRGLAHTFLVGDAGARLLTFTLPSGFASFIEEMGEPAHGQAIPAPAPLDPARLGDVAARFGIEVTGPPPQPAR
jgi:mannose-6-phosphate isomerase-like protein (cupin superfamily)